jgi:hypothetical protein
MALKDAVDRFSNYVKENYYRPSEETDQLTGRGYDPNANPTIVNTMFDAVFNPIKPAAKVETTKSETLGIFALLIIGGILLIKL